MVVDLPDHLVADTATELERKEGAYDKMYFVADGDL
jgi:hypothetical protein